MSDKKKRGWLAALVVYLIPIILSAFANDNITNEKLRHVVLFCYSIRFELVLILIASVFLYVFIIVVKRLIKRDRYWLNTAILVSCILVVLPVCYINLRRIVFDRRTYYENNYHQSQIQYLPFIKANELFSNGEFEKAKDYYDIVKSLQRDGYYSHAAEERIQYIDKVIEFRETLYSYFNPDTQAHLSLTDYRGLYFLKEAFPGSFKYEYDLATTKVEQAIAKYDQLYNAVNEHNYDLVQELISENGWCWFEQELFDLFTLDGKEIVMKRLDEYVSMEPLDHAFARLRNKWIVEE